MRTRSSATTTVGSSLRSLRRLGVSAGSLAICLAASLAVIAWGLARSMSFHAAHGWTALGLVALFLAALAVYTTVRRDALMASLIAGLTIQVWSSISLGLLAMLGLSAGLPLADPALARIDAAFGIDHPAMLAWWAERPVPLRALTFAYSLSGPMNLAVLLVLAFTGQFQRLRRFTFLWTATLAGAVAISTLVPAIGVYAHHAIADDILARLPAGAGTYHLATFRLIAAGAWTEIDPAAMDGVVTFPSFHVCMALAIAYGLARTRWLGPAALLYAAAVIVATVPIGGHYVIDLVAGAGLFAAVAWLSRPRWAVRFGRVRAALRARLAPRRAMPAATASPS